MGALRVPRHEKSQGLLYLYKRKIRPRLVNGPSRQMQLGVSEDMLTYVHQVTVDTNVGREEAESLLQISHSLCYGFIFICSSARSCLAVNEVFDAKQTRLKERERL